MNNERTTASRLWVSHSGQTSIVEAMQLYFPSLSPFFPIRFYSPPPFPIPFPLSLRLESELFEIQLGYEVWWSAVNSSSGV